MLQMKEWAAGIGSVVSAILASACCVGPLLAVMLGIGGLGAAASLEVYRPYFLGMTFVLLGGAFYMTYGSRQRCGEGDACDVPEGNGWRRILLWMAAAAALVSAAVPYLLELVV